MFGPQHAHHLGVRVPRLLLPTEEIPCLGKAVLTLTALLSLAATALPLAAFCLAGLTALLSLAATALPLAAFCLAGLTAAGSWCWFRRLARRGTLGFGGVGFGGSRSRLGLLLGFGGWGYVRHSG